MESHELLHIANFTTLFVCMVLKFPQIFLLMRAKSTKGVSLNSLLLELIGYLVFVAYQMYYDYPPPTYLEYPILIAQDAMLLLLILHYNGDLRQSFGYAFVFIVGWKLITVQKWIIDLAMSLCTFISAGSKFAQLQCLWRTKDSNQVSALSWSLAIYTTLTRIYTTVMTTGDTQVLVRFVVMGLLNIWVLATVLHYRKKDGSNNSSSTKKED
ncbi:solute carrier family 66 member 3 [Gadus macrocephalus]|uniref:solute carrier family 66 member 3 n=1 Tax=Gadus macrocephalus TaxID=80720 RepID=UPI0028CB2118|nr:solute carrier family 66 member 3 [Gadus macrocephalus]